MGMSEEFLFLEPYCREVLWGGDRLQKRFGYRTHSAHTGEAWVVSAVSEDELAETDNRAGYAYPGESVVVGGAFDGCPLSHLWKTDRSLFGGLEGERFPLLVKYLDAREDLSVQVHPDDSYAASHEHTAIGKQECWYIVDCAKDGDVIVGHNAPDRETLHRLVRAGDWDRLLTVLPIRRGDFFHIPAGILHAIRSDTLVLEIEQTSNLTYRVFDYDRVVHGQKRPLHIEKALDVITCPQRAPVTAEKAVRVDENGMPGLTKDKRLGNIRQCLINGPSFYAEKWEVGRRLTIPRTLPFLIICVMDGMGTVNGRPLWAGATCIATSLCGTLHFEGRMTFITTGVPPHDA